jgi:short-subunit dehydrogenase
LGRSLVAITGASSGIGAAFARKLAPDHDLLLIARRRDRLEQLAAEFGARYATATHVIAADLTRDEDSGRVADRLANDPALILLINNAGFGARARFWESPLQIQEDMHKLHVMATLRLTHAALRNLVSRDTGGIVNVSSVSAFIRRPGTISYSATKSWMTSFTEGLYLELKAMRSNVVVQALCPGFTYSEFHDKMSVDRQELAGPSFWLTAEQVVEASLEGLRRRKLFVIPGWRYRVLAMFLTNIPTSLRLAVESVAAHRKQRQLAIREAAQKQLSSNE